MNFKNMEDEDFKKSQASMHFDSFTQVLEGETWLGGRKGSKPAQVRLDKVQERNMDWREEGGKPAQVRQDWEEEGKATQVRQGYNAQHYERVATDISVELKPQ